MDKSEEVKKGHLDQYRQHATEHATSGSKMLESHAMQKHGRNFTSVGGDPDSLETVRKETHEKVRRQQAQNQ